jgi:hypothetical protein
MSNVTRICSQCSHANPLDARYCGRCGYDFQSALPARAQNNLPELVNKAALPVLATAAGLALSAGWKLLQSLLESQSAPPARQAKPDLKVKSQPPAPRTKSTVRIRASWQVSDANGYWRKGETDHTIEFED